MRTLLPVYLLLALPLSAQTTFAPVGATWTYRTGTSSSPWIDPYGQYSISVTGDTVINGTDCSIIHFPVGTDCGFPDAMTAQRDIFTCVRSDSVFWYNGLNGSFDLIMDYGAASGDEWDIPLNYDNSGEWLHDTATYHVWSVDTLWHDGEPLRRLHYSTTLTTGFFQGGGSESVERLGDTQYMIPWRTCSDGIFEGPLLCYSDPSLNWPAPLVSCDLWLATSEQAPADELFTVAPTIVETGGMVIVTVPSSSIVEVADATGRLVNSVKGASEDVRFSMQEPGIYFVRANIGSRPIGTRRVLVL